MPTSAFCPRLAAAAGALALTLPVGDGIAATAGREPAAWRSPVQSPPAQGVIVGRVVRDLTTEPVPHALVTLIGRSGARLRRPVLATAGGDFVFTDVAAGLYDVEAGAAGHWPGLHGQRRAAGPGRAIAVAAGRNVIEVVVPVWPLAAVSGRVTDHEGEPLEGLQVRAFGFAAMGGRRWIWTESPRTALTDDRGAFRLGGLQPGEYVIATSPAVEADGRAYPPAFHPGAPIASEATPVAVAGGEERTGVDFRLRAGPAAAVAGRVVDEAGRPLGGVRLRLTRDDPAAAADAEFAAAVSAPDGSFAFDRALPGDYVIAAVDAAASGLGPAATGAAETPRDGLPGEARRAGRAAVTVDHRGVAGLVVALRPTARVTGTLVFDGGGPMPAPDDVRRVIVHAGSASGRLVPGLGAPSAVVSADATFRSVGLPPGQYFVRALPASLPRGWHVAAVRHGGRDVTDAPIDLQHEDVTGLAIVLSPASASVRGVVRGPAGSPDAAATVLLFPTDARLWTGHGRDSPRFRSARADLGGAYVLDGLLAGEYYATAVADEHAAEWHVRDRLERLSAGAARVRVAAGAGVVLDLRTAGGR